MCGRYGLWSRQQRIEELLGLPPSGEERLSPLYNVAPGAYRWIARLDEERLNLVPHFWGLTPYWVKDPKKNLRPINARSDTVAGKPMFRRLLRDRRCLVPADCYYEWKETPSGRIPYCFRMASGEPFCFAGLWDIWHEGQADAIPSFALLTTEPNERAATVHDRMPVIVQTKDYRRWLDPGVTASEKLADILGPYPGEMVAYAVNRQVNSPKNEGPALIDPEVPAPGEQ